MLGNVDFKFQYNVNIITVATPIVISTITQYTNKN